MTATQEEKFVVLHMGIGRDFTNGQVVSRKDIEDMHASVDRLLAKKAIRRATHFELGETKVEFKEVDRPSHHHDINELQETINHKNNRISELENQVAVLTQQISHVQKSAPTQGIQQLLKSKEDLIRSLQLRISELDGQLAAERKKYADDSLLWAKLDNDEKPWDSTHLGHDNPVEEYDPLG